MLNYCSALLYTIVYSMVGGTLYHIVHKENTLLYFHSFLFIKKMCKSSVGLFDVTPSVTITILHITIQWIFTTKGIYGIASKIW